MNPIQYSDIFDFSNASEPEKFVRAVNEMEKALTDLQAKAQKVAAESAKVLQVTADAAAKAAEQVAVATEKELEALSKKAAALKKSSDEAKKSKELAEEQAQSLGDLQKYLNALKKAYDVNANNVEEMNRKIAETTQQIKINQQAIREAQASTQQATNIDINQLKTYNQKSQALNELRKRYKELNPAIKEQREEMGRLLVSIQRLDKEVKGIDASMGNFQRNVGNYRSALAGVISRFPGAGDLSGIIAGAGGAATAIAAIGVAVIGAVNTITSKSQEAVIKFQGLQKAIRAVSDTTTEADTNLRFLFSEADRLGLSVTDLAESFKSFMASAKGTVLQGNEARKIFTAVASASAALNLSSDATNRALTALSQMMSKGKVSAEELRQQLGEALPGATKAMEKALGVTSRQLEEMMKKGQVLAADALPKLAKVLMQDYGGAEATGLQAAINRMNNAFDSLYTNIGTRLEPFLKATYEQLTKFANNVNKIFQTPEQRMQEVVASRVENIRFFMQEKNTTSIEDYKKALADLTEQQKKFNEVDAKTLENLENRLKALLLAPLPDVDAVQRTQVEINNLKKRKDAIETNIRAVTQIIEEEKQAQINAERAKQEEIARKEAEAAEKSEKAQKERIKELKKMRSEYEQWLMEYTTRVNFIDIEALQRDFQKSLDELLKEQQKEAARQLAQSQALAIEAPKFEEEKTESPFSLFSFADLSTKKFDSFLDFQLAVIDNNKAISDTFSEIGNQLNKIFGDNPFTQFLQQAIEGYQAFLKVQELGIVLKKKDTAATAANTSAAVTNAGAQGAVAVTKTAAQSGIGALATVPAVLAVITAAIGLVKSLFAGFEEGTEFLGKDQPNAPLGKDAIPIVAARGERILSYKQNAQLGNISNEDLVKYAKLGMLQGDFATVGRPAIVITKQDSSKSDAEAIAKALASEMQKLPVTVNVWDESGYHSHTQKMNKLRLINKKWFA